ncbi:MAG: hypothetical protein N2654_06265 [Deltaproteobacteria bacterium]|nr:hypothetical protein [Deltaproteobacteria bacterium]
MKLIFVILTFISCGKYSPATSPDMFRPASPKINSIELEQGHQRVIKIALGKDLKLVNQTPLTSPDGAVCWLRKNDQDPIYIQGNIIKEGDTWVVVCEIPREFVGTVKVAVVKNSIRGLPSKNHVNVYSKETFDAYITE